MSHTLVRLGFLDYFELRGSWGILCIRQMDRCWKLGYVADRNLCSWKKFEVKVYKASGFESIMYISHSVKFGM